MGSPGWVVSGSSRRAVPSHTAPPTVTPGGQSRAATRGARLVRCPGTHSSGSSACTLARPPAAREASPALNLAAPDVCIPPRRARGALPTCRLRSAIRSPRCSVAATPTPQDSPGPGGTPGHLLPETPFVLLPPPGPSLPSTHPGCKRPCRQRQSAAPSHEHCGAPPRVQCGAPPARGQSRERSRRRARARLEGRAERRRGARATPTRARPRGSRGQSARAGGAEPSAGLVHWPGAHRPTGGGGIPPRSQVCKLGQKTAAHRWRKRGNSGPVRAAGSHGGSTAICLLRLQVPSCARPRLLQAVYFTVAQQLRVLTSTTERQRPGQISLPIVPCGETPLGLRAGAPNPKSFDFCHGELRLGWKMGGRQAGRQNLHSTRELRCEDRRKPRAKQNSTMSNLFSK